MNEKIKNFFACIGGIFSVAFAVLVGIFIGKRSRGNNVDGGAMGEVQTELGKVTGECERLGNYQSETSSIIADSQSIIAECNDIVAEVERRNSKAKN